MKKSIRDLFRWGGLSGILLGLIGFNTACRQQMSMYGPPPEGFTSKIKVTDQASQPIEGIEIMWYRDGNSRFPDRIYETNRDGLVYGLSNYSVDTLWLRFKDTDGVRNGGVFVDTTVTIPISITAPEWSYTMKMRKVANKSE